MDVTETLEAIRTAQARAATATSQAAAARMEGNVGKADELIRQAQVESERAAAAAQLAQQQAQALASGELVRRRSPLPRIPWWAWLGVAGVGALVVKKLAGGRRRRRGRK